MSRIAVGPGSDPVRPRPTLAGSIPPLVSPLDADRRLDRVALERQLDRMVGAVDGLLILGTTGELAILDPRAADELVGIAAERVGAELRLVLGIGAAGTAGVLAELRRCRPGITAVAACSPYYMDQLPNRALRDHFTAIADAADVPLVLYDIPSKTANKLPLEVVMELAEHPNVIGIKDSSADVAAFDALLAARPDGFAVLQGTREGETGALYRRGVDGFVAGCENIVPGAIRAVLTAVDADDAEAEVRALARIASASRVFAIGYPISAVKAAVGMLVGSGGYPAAPLPELTGDERAAVAAVLDDLGLERAV